MAAPSWALVSLPSLANTAVANGLSLLRQESSPARPTPAPVSAPAAPAGPAAAAAAPAASPAAEPSNPDPAASEDSVGSSRPARAGRGARRRGGAAARRRGGRRHAGAETQPETQADPETQGTEAETGGDADSLVGAAAADAESQGGSATQGDAATQGYSADTEGGTQQDSLASATSLAGRPPSPPGPATQDTLSRPASPSDGAVGRGPELDWLAQHLLTQAMDVDSADGGGSGASTFSSPVKRAAASQTPASQTPRSARRAPSARTPKVRPAAGGKETARTPGVAGAPEPSAVAAGVATGAMAAEMLVEVAEAEAEAEAAETQAAVRPLGSRETRAKAAAQAHIATSAGLPRAAGGAAVATALAPRTRFLPSPYPAPRSKTRLDEITFTLAHPILLLFDENIPAPPNLRSTSAWTHAPCADQQASVIFEYGGDAFKMGP
jgi:hypothetical protein